MDFAKNWNKDSVENKIKDKIFEFVYGCALHDAILQLAFKDEKNGFIKLMVQKMN